MADHMAGEIRIGGRIVAKLLPLLCAAITHQGVSLEWGDGYFCPESADDLLAGCREDDEVRLLWLCDDQARWGQFDDLEKFLIQHGISFSRHSDAKNDFDPETLDFRPGFDIISTCTNAAGEPVVAVSRLAEVDKVLDAAQRTTSLPTALQAIRNAQRLLQAQLPPALPPLEPFEIITDLKQSLRPR